MIFLGLYGVDLRRISVVIGGVLLEPYWPLGACRVREVARADIAQIGTRVAFPSHELKDPGPGTRSTRLLPNQMPLKGSRLNVGLKCGVISP